MVDGDIPAGLSLCRAAGWNQTAEDWAMFLKLSPKGCCVAVDDEGQVRGTVATVRYENRFSWIGMVLVHPAVQRQGIGIQLLRESLQILGEEETIKLDATPAGRKVYVQLDFVDEYPITRMELKEVSVSKLENSDALPVLTKEMPSVLEIDHRVFGASRGKVLQSVLKRAPQFAFFLQDSEGIEGYCFGRKGYLFSHIGPVIARDSDSARKVVSAALRNCQGRPVVIDAPHHSPEWLQWLSSIGFREQRPLLRMYRGTNAYPGIPEKQFAILGPEFG